MWGGIWRAPNTYIINSDNSNQKNVVLLTKFNEWEYSNWHGIGQRLPYLQGHRLTTGTGTGTKWGSITGKKKTCFL